LFLSFCLGAALFSYFQIFVDKMIILGLVLIGCAILWAKGIFKYIFWGILSFFLGWLYLSVWHLPQILAETENFKSNGFVDGYKEQIAGYILCPLRTEEGRILLDIYQDENNKNFCLPGNKLEVSGEINSDLTPKERFVERFSGKLKVKKIQLINSKPQGFLRLKLAFLKNLYLAREKFSQVLSSLMRQKEASFAQGLVFGGKTNFSKDFKNKLARTGTSHLVALSGFNISILIFASFDTLKFISPILGFALTSVLILAFVLMTGAASSVVRAAIVGMMLISGKVLGRQTDHLLILSLSLFLMTLLEPFSLVWDVGLQLSFAAFVGLIYLSPLIKEKLIYFGFLGEIIADTIGAILFTLPLVAYYFGNISLIALLVNILVVAVIPITTYLVLFVGFFGLISGFLGKVLSYITQVFLNYSLGIIEFFGQFSWAQIKLNISSAIWIFVYYLILGLIVCFLWQRKLKNETL